MPSTTTLRAFHSTIAGEAIQAVLERDYDLGPIESCGLLKRGFNDSYEVRGRDGVGYIARLYVRRHRGPANVDFETTFLRHLSEAGLLVGVPVPRMDGRLWCELEAPEGPREFAVFRRLDGRFPLRRFLAGQGIDDRTLADVLRLGADHARLHIAGESYRGPASLYRLEGDLLLLRPLAQLLALPILDDDLRAGFATLGQTLSDRLAEVAPSLSLAVCHGDNHGWNAFITEVDGKSVVAWFDFDDGGPGFLAYDLSVFVWDLIHGAQLTMLTDERTRLWSAFLEGYRSVRSIPPADFDAIGLFICVRTIWLIGETASQLSKWGTGAISTEWFRRELALIRDWGELATPAE